MQCTSTSILYFLEPIQVNDKLMAAMNFHVESISTLTYNTYFKYEFEIHVYFAKLESRYVVLKLRNSFLKINLSFL